MEAEYQGTKTDVSLKNGPTTARSCTDIFFCLIFLIFVVSTLAVTIYANKNGNAQLLMTPFDPDHRACGVDAAVKDYPFIYFTNPTPTTLYDTVCVKNCPDGTSATINCATNSLVKSCTGTLITLQMAQVQEDIRLRRKIVHSDDEIQKVKRIQKIILNRINKITPSFVVYKSTPLGTMCIPQVTQYYQAVTNALPAGVQNGIKDIQSTYQLLIASAAIALFVSFTFMFLVRYFAGLIVWFFIAMINAAFIGLATVSYFTYKNYNVNLNLEDGSMSQAKATASNIIAAAQASNISQQQWLYIAIGFGIVALIFLFVTVWYRRRLSLAVAITKTATLFMRDNLSALLMPVLVFFILLAFMIYWIGVALLIYSIGEVSKQPNQLPYGQFTIDKQTQYLFAYHVFSGLWITAFITTAADFVIVSATSIWYFRRGSGQLKFQTSPIKDSIVFLFLYHLGSVAFGALILAVVYAFQLALRYLQWIAKKSQSQDNLLVRYSLACCLCYSNCLERFVQFVNKNAFTIIAMTSKNFCDACEDSFYLMVRNASRFVIAGGIGDLFILIGKLFVTGITALKGYLIIIYTPQLSSQVTSPIYPTIAMAIIGYVVGSIFMSVYGTVMDAILIVFTMDEEIEKTSGNGQAANCPAPLKEFMKLV